LSTVSISYFTVIYSIQK
ncbi:hypothetical protein DMN91_001777, partial [Ooceraea biroi]